MTQDVESLAPSEVDALRELLREAAQGAPALVFRPAQGRLCAACQDRLCASCVQAIRLDLAGDGRAAG